MKKNNSAQKVFVYFLLALCVIGLTGCGQKTTKTSDTNSLSSTSSTMCANAVQEYLSKADTKGKSSKQVKKGHKITVHYIGRLDDENVFDTSIEEIAKACGKYMTGRNYNEGLSFEVGAGQMIAGFDKGVEGMNIGQTKTIHIEASEAYGEWSEKNLVKVPREQIPNNDQLEKGIKLMSSYGQAFTIYELSDKEVTLDANHELAGKKLIFDITVQDIQE